MPRRIICMLCRYPRPKLPSWRIPHHTHRAKAYFRVSEAFRGLDDVPNAYKSMSVAATLEPTNQLYVDSREALRLALASDLSAQELDEIESQVEELLPPPPMLDSNQVRQAKPATLADRLPVTVLSGFLGCKSW
jgi:hypothetical protein